MYLKTRGAVTGSRTIREGRARLAAGILTLCAIALAGCAAHSLAQVNEAPTGDAGPAEAVATGPGVALAPPLELLELLQATRGASYFDFELVRTGNEFEAALPNQDVTADGSTALFEPDWQPGTGLDGLAYCVYSFHVPDYDLAPQVSLDWKAQPDDSKGMYIALGQWDSNSWRWYDYKGGGTLGLVDIAPYFTAEGDLLIVLASTSAEPWQLNSLRLGPNPAGDWLHTWGTPLYDDVTDIAVDPRGSIYICEMPTTFDTENNGMVLLKYDARGNFAWARSWDSSDIDDVVAVAVSPQGDVYCCGALFTYDVSPNRLILQKWTSDGDLLWAKACMGPEIDAGHSLAVTSDAVYVVGDWWADADADDDTAAWKFDLDGDLLAAKTYDIGAGKHDWAINLALATDTEGATELHIVGMWNSGTSFRPLYLKLDDALDVQQVMMWDGTATQLWPVSIAVADTPARRVYIGGYKDDLPSDQRLFILEAAPTGTLLARTWGYSDWSIGGGVLWNRPGEGLAISGHAHRFQGSTTGVVQFVDYNGTVQSTLQLLNYGTSNYYASGIAGYGNDRMILSGEAYEGGAWYWGTAELDTAQIIGSWMSMSVSGTDEVHSMVISDVQATEIDGVLDTDAGEGDAFVCAKTLE